MLLAAVMTFLHLGELPSGKVTYTGLEETCDQQWQQLKPQNYVTKEELLLQLNERTL